MKTRLCLRRSIILNELRNLQLVSLVHWNNLLERYKQLGGKDLSECVRECVNICRTLEFELSRSLKLMRHVITNVWKNHRKPRLKLICPGCLKTDIFLQIIYKIHMRLIFHHQVSYIGLDSCAFMTQCSISMTLSTTKHTSLG